MNLAWLSLGALIVAMIVSCVSEINVGVLALALAWLVGVYAGGMGLNEVLSGFPVQLFLTLAGVTLLFTQAQLNGTLDRVAQAAVRACRGNAGVIPVMFFALACLIASVGPGNVATAAMMAPMAMAVAGRAGIPPFLMAIMVGNGAQAGALSPFAPTGIIVTGLMTKIGLGGFELRTYLANLLAHALVAFGGYFLMGGWRLFAARDSSAAAEVAGTVEFNATHAVTLACIAVRPRRRALPRSQHRHGGVHRRRRPDDAAGRRPRAGDPENALDAHRDGVRRQRAGGAAREDEGARPVHRRCWRRSRRRARSPAWSRSSPG